ncbi:MAG: chemotaxis protein CheC [Nitrospina sp.]|nr:chemotaxis protein CheC [Nitrospina sp.]MBT3415221.1 chemotaxis protein CheC [Nitrospina sp.]MBT3857245.1 chemotaxis protein CheC [Nitrospina sp.]MBT4104569.1 chemotaxis protein CheC [Nitrospina sp.]MBT4390164.1 chemotaxis protein CheC [Nitrospina sp.]
MKLTEDQIDALGELFNIGVGKGADMLNQMLGCQIRIRVPHIETLTLNELEKQAQEFGPKEVSTVNLSFEGSLSGNAMLAFPPQSAQNLVSALTGEEPGSPELDSVTMDTLSEVGNIIINSVMGSITNFVNQRLDYSVPHYAENAIHKLVGNHIDDPEYSIILAKAHFSIENLEVDGEIILIFGVGSLEALLQAIEAFKKKLESG